jgi:hypothetical protein
MIGMVEKKRIKGIIPVFFRKLLAFHGSEQSAKKLKQEFEAEAEAEKEKES